MTQKTKATRSAAGGAGGLFSCLDFYSRFEGLSQVHSRMVSAGVTLNKAVKSALRETVVGSNSDSRDSLLADVISSRVGIDFKHWSCCLKQCVHLFVII